MSKTTVEHLTDDALQDLIKQTKVAVNQGMSLLAHAKRERNRRARYRRKANAARRENTATP